MRMTKSVRENHNIKSRNKTLTIVTIMLTIALLLSQFMFWTQRDEITVYIPPQFDKGVVLKAGEKDPNTVWGFANYIFQYLNNWPLDGEKDYRKNINGIAYYSSGLFSSYLDADYKKRLDRKGINELNRRRRQLLPIGDKPYSDDSVRKISTGVWDVVLHYQLKEFIGQRLVKDEPMKFVLRVISADANPAANQWGLQIHKQVLSERINVRTN